MVEVLGRYSNHADQVRRIEQLLSLVPATPIAARTRTIRQVHRRLKPDAIDELVVGYEAGLTVRQLGEQFGIGRETVSKILGRRGVATRYQSLTPDQTESAAQLYNSGLSLLKVADQLGVSRGAISNALGRAGVDLRPRNGWKYAPKS